jgi:hypothetical protein
LLDFATLRLSQGSLPTNFLNDTGMATSEVLFARLYDPNLTSDETMYIVYDIERVRGSTTIQLNRFLFRIHMPT